MHRIGGYFRESQKVGQIITVYVIGQQGNDFGGTLSFKIRQGYLIQVRSQFGVQDMAGVELERGTFRVYGIRAIGTKKQAARMTFYVLAADVWHLFRVVVG